jgi:type III secretion system FlhB-like substrate exporter
LKGSGPLAEEILQAHGPARRPPVVRNEALLEQLYRLPIDGEIGPELYRVVALILVHVFAVEQAMKGETGD